MAMDTRELSRAMAPDEGGVVDDIVQRLLGRSARMLDESEVRDRVRRELERFAEARVRTFIPILVERAVDEALAEGHHVGGLAAQ
jgi:uncharacterized membrane-anchored protein YjiN (DUF445 family)